MDTYQILIVITCVTSTMTALIVSVALLPHLKDGVVMVRDAVLWLALIVLLALLVWLGIEHFGNATPVATETLDVPAVSPPVGDKYYAGRTLK